MPVTENKTGGGDATVGAVGEWLQDDTVTLATANSVLSIVVFRNAIERMLPSELARLDSNGDASVFGDVSVAWLRVRGVRATDRHRLPEFRRSIVEPDVGAAEPRRTRRMIFGDRLADSRCHRSRNNLVFMSQAGYNYDRERVEGEGTDWPTT